MTIFNRQICLPHLDGLELDSDMQFAPNLLAEVIAQSRGVSRIDANESMIFALQLQHLRNQIMMRPYPAYKAKNLLPMQSESSPGDEEFAYIVGDRVGVFQLIANYADDLPVTDIKGQKKVVDIKEYGGAVHYSIADQEKAATAGIPLIERKMAANREAAEAKFDEIAWVGDATAGLYGITNHPNITSVATVGPTWATATAQQIYDALARPMVQQATDTKGTEKPTHIVLSAAKLERARNVFFGDNTGDSALKRFKEAYPEVTIETVERMSTAGPGGVEALLAFNKDPMKIGVEAPLPYMVMPPEQRNLTTIVNARLRTAGAVVYFPLSVTMVYGI